MEEAEFQQRLKKLDENGGYYIELMLINNCEGMSKAQTLVALTDFAHMVELCKRKLMGVKKIKKAT